MSIWRDVLKRLGIAAVGAVVDEGVKVGEEAAGITLEEFEREILEELRLAERIGPECAREARRVVMDRFADLRDRARAGIGLKL